MERAEFQQLVRRLEAEARVSPARNRLGAMAFAWLGQAAFLLLAVVLVLLGVATTGLVFVAFKNPIVLVKGWKVLWLPFAGLYGLGKIVFARVPPVPGIDLSADRHPELFARIERLRTNLGAPRLDRVVLAAELNAGVTYEPRFAFLPMRKRVLVLGMTLLETVTVDELDAILGHELAHIAGGDVGRGQSLYRSRLWWLELERAQHANRGFTAGLVSMCLDWYLPRLLARTFVIARENEYAADRASAALTSPRVVADALTRTRIASITLDKHYWRDVFAGTKASRNPPRNVYTALAAFVATEKSGPESELALEQAMRAYTDESDTHPSLHDRLAALGMESRIPHRLEKGAADALLGELAPTYRARFDADFESAMLSPWDAAHRRAKESEKRLDDLESADSLEVEQAFERALLVETVRGRDSGLVAYQAFHEIFPTDVRGRHALASAQVDADDAEGVAMLEDVAANHPDLRLHCLGTLAGFALRRGDRAEADSLLHRMDVEQKRLIAIDRGHNVFDKATPLAPAGDVPEVRAALATMLAGIERVGGAYLARRPIEAEGVTESALFFVVLISHPTSDEPHVRDARVKKIETTLVERKPAELAISVFCMDDVSWARRKLDAVPGARIG